MDWKLEVVVVPVRDVDRSNRHKPPEVQRTSLSRIGVRGWGIRCQASMVPARDLCRRGWFWNRTPRWMGADYHAPRLGSIVNLRQQGVSYIPLRRLKLISK